MSEVKSRKTKMEQRSDDTRARIVQAAYQLFCDSGFRATTMDAIGVGAGVSVQTVYFQFRTKNEILRAVHEWTVLGDERVPPHSQQWAIDALGEHDARTAVERLVEGTAQLNARIAPTLPIFTTLAREPGGEIYRESRRQRRAGMEEVVRVLRTKTPLRPGLTFSRAVDILDFLMGPECYAELVLQSEWSRRAWVSWTSAAIVDQLFGQD